MLELASVDHFFFTFPFLAAEKFPSGGRECRTLRILSEFLSLPWSLLIIGMIGLGYDGLVLWFTLDVMLLVNCSAESCVGCQ